MIDERFDNLEEMTEDSDLEEQAQLYEHFRVVADKGQEPLRVDKFLFEHLQHSSRNRIQKAAEAGFIHVNDRPVKSNYKVRPLDVVTLMLDRPHYDDTIEAEDIPLTIVYEDDDLILPEGKDSYTPEELRDLLISDLKSIYGMKDAV